MILAAIDIGSNAVRLLINVVETNQGKVEFQKAAYLRVPVRLGEDVFSTGYISEQKQQALNDAMTGFSYIMKAYEVNTFMACATSAMRDAANGNEVIKAIKQQSGININLISGAQEADFIYKAGGIGNLMDDSQNYLYVDVGGGSTEVVVYSKKQKVASHSFQMGTVRMLAGDGISEAAKEEFKIYLSGLCRDFSPLNIIASGGNINKIHKLLSKKEKEPIKTNELLELYREMRNMSFEERMQHFQLNAYRADVIIPALYIFTTVAQSCHVNDIYVPKVGLSDGIICHLYQENTQNTQR